MFGDVLALTACSLFTSYPYKLVIRLQSIPWLISTHDIAPVRHSPIAPVRHSPIDMFPSHINSAPLEWTDRKTQTRGTRTYSSLICNLLHIVAEDIALPMDAVTIHVKYVEVALWFRLAKIAIFWSSARDVALLRPAAGLRATVCVVWN